MLFLKIILLVSIVFLNAKSIAQETQILPFSNNQEPGSFLQIESENARVVFKKKYKHRAVRVLNSVDSHAKALSENFKKKADKITIFLRSETTQSNGFVRLAPYKSEFFDAPFLEGELDEGEWLEMLSIHEYRHVVQFAQLKDGFSKSLYYFLGEFGLSFSSFWSTPRWVYEGDATIAETEFTTFGRGRNAIFSRRLRALLKYDTDLSYESLYFNTPFEDIPSFYKFGYYFLHFLNISYGFDIEGSFSSVTSKSYNPFAYLNIIEKQTDKKISTLIQEFLKFYKKEWKRDIDEVGVVLSPSPNYTTNYLYPHLNSNMDIIVLKTGVLNRRQFFNTRTKKILHYPGRILTNNINSYKDSIYWIENRLDLRFQTRSYNSICKLNIVNEEQGCFRQTGHETSYDEFENQSITASFDGRYKIQLYEKKQKKKTFSFKNFDVIIGPQFINKDEAFFIKKNKDGFFSLNLLNLQTLIIKEILSSKSPIRRARFFSGKIYFEWEKSSVEEIYNIDLNTKKVNKLTNSNIASVHVLPHSEGIYVSRMFEKGFGIVKLTDNGSVKDDIDKQSESLYVFPKGDYSKTSDLKFEAKEFVDESFNLHSWLIIPPLVSPSFSLSAQSQNISETLLAQASVSYFSLEKTGGVSSLFSFQKYFLHFDIGADHRQRSIQITSSSKKYKTWHETNLYGGPRLFLNKNWGRWYELFEFAYYISRIDVDKIAFEESGGLRNGKTKGGVLEASYFIGAEKNQVEALSPMSFSLNYTFRDLDNVDNNQKGKFSNLESRVTFGFLNKYSVSINYEKEKQLDGGYQYLSDLIQARGYSLGFSSSIESMKFDFIMPILNLDGNLLDYIHFNRFNIGFFFDRMSFADDVIGTALYESYGLEATSNLFFFRTIGAPIGVGVRFFYKNTKIVAEDRSGAELFLNTAIAF